MVPNPAMSAQNQSGVYLQYNMSGHPIVDAPTVISKAVSGTILVVFALVGIPGNLITLLVYVTRGQRHRFRMKSSTLRILGNLTAADLIGSCANIPVCFALFLFSSNQNVTQLLSKVHMLITTPALFINCVCLVLLSLDRHDSLLRANQHRLRSRKMRFVFAFLWIAALVIGVVGFNSFQGFIVWRPESYLWDSPNSLLLFVGVIAAISVMISHVKIKRSFKMNQRVSPEFSGASRLHDARKLAELRVTRVMVLITVVLLLTYLPWAACRFLFLAKRRRFHSDVYVICRVMLLTSHVIHPLLFWSVSSEFRRVTKVLLCQCNRENR
ncbi:melanopsin-like [Nematostella vectensis]|uniref:melanopsin-like n=1 Tax=Nematostella vectensis TaxID=45351 RepID=UPI0020775DE3|nr:melanopsin-like [Nematostella vectensis]XP_032230114.2 melanopsin-like [Nematostella vectensis]